MLSDFRPPGPAHFPEGVACPGAIWAALQGLMVYLNDQHFIPYQRLARICEDLFGQPLSEATMAAANERAYEKSGALRADGGGPGAAGPGRSLDESGLRVARTLHWLHVVSNRDADLLRRPSQARRRGDGRFGHLAALPPVGRP